MSDDMRPAAQPAEPRPAQPAEPRPACPRTRDFIVRVANDRVTADDRLHAPGCAACGPILATAARFDDALRRSARDLVAEPLPDGILDPAILPHRPDAMGRRALPNFAGLLAAVVILVMASSLGILPGGQNNGTGGPKDSAAPSQTQPNPGDTGLGMRVTLFRMTVSVIPDLEKIGYICYPGKELSGGPGNFDPEREGVACKTGTDESSYGAMVATRERGEGEAKEVVEVSMDGSLGGTDSARALRDLADAFGQATVLVLADDATGRAVSLWVVDAVPSLQVQAQGDEVTGLVRGVQITLTRNPQGRFHLLLATARP